MMKLGLREEVGVSILTVFGSVDIENADSMGKAIEELCHSGKLRIVIDLGDLRYIDTSGLGRLINSVKMVREMGGDIKLAGLGYSVKDIFRRTKTDKLFECYDSVGEAVRAFRPASHARDTEERGRDDGDR
ncbi:MAG: STAS domain-containing protein [bacterium]